ncbi:META domain-containing protein [Terrimonas pollutisoli]|uniref:META domain-containing protein n=1 Tax=Terrimonas pollutisoli TaxID=3034147 RepID=UPI0023EE218F|nr:META domain-containing protein [Terrimonas sp. H1YJ31]
MQKIFFSASVLTIVIMAAGCGSSKSTAGTSGGSEMLYQYQWNLEILDGQPVNTSTGKGSYLLFSPGQVNTVAGNAGCNNLRGSFELSGENAMKFSPLMTTKMACPDINIETSFLDALSKVDNWSIIGDQLLLSNGKIPLAKLRGVKPIAKPVSTAPNASLIGTWELNYISGKKIAFEGLYPKTKPQLTFTDSKTEVGGHTSCNSFSSKLTIDENKIMIAEPTAMTMMACEGEGEKSFLDMLKKVNKYALSGTTLTFLMDDIAVMRFEKK